MLADQLKSATSFIDLCRRLGLVCLDREAELAACLADPRVAAFVDRFVEAIEASRPDAWLRPSDNGDFTHVLGFPGFEDHLSIASTHHPVEYVAVLRGLCRGPLPHFYEALEDTLTLERGMPVPLATRPVNLLFADCTPYQPTLHSGDLVDPRGAFWLFEHASSSSIRVDLDYRVRDAIDEIGWANSRLPLIATLHPDDGGPVSRTVTNAYFFDTGPTNWSAEAALGLLSQARINEADIALLPEFSLPRPDALEVAIRERSEDYPRLIVAGSGHVRSETASGEVRANECRVYLDGDPVLIAHKIKAYEWREPEISGEPRRILREHISGEQKTIRVLSGSQTRLAVVICSDLNDATIPRLLEHVGVNLLLVPSVTPKIGAMTGALSRLASSCQGIGVIANGQGPIYGQDPPFLLLAGVPHASPADQTHLVARPNFQAPLLALIDPNLPLAKGIRVIPI